MIISVASQKGGVGKTSTAISLAAGLARKQKKILLIDIDSQSNTSKVILPDYPSIKPNETIYTTILERNPLPVRATVVPNLYIVPSHILLSNTDIELTTAIDHREARLKAELEKIAPDYDFVIIDCPPTLSWLTINALTASDKVIVVVSPGYFELDSIVQISKTIQEVREYFNPLLELLGFLFTMSDPTINTSTWEARLKPELDKIATEYDYVIIDCPPTLFWLTINVLNAVDRVRFVVFAGYFELDRLNQMGKQVQLVVENYNWRLTFRIDS